MSECCTTGRVLQTHLASTSIIGKTYVCVRTVGNSRVKSTFRPFDALCGHMLVLLKRRSKNELCVMCNRKYTVCLDKIHVVICMHRHASRFASAVERAAMHRADNCRMCSASSRVYRYHTSIISIVQCNIYYIRGGESHCVRAPLLGGLTPETTTLSTLTWVLYAQTAIYNTHVVLYRHMRLAPVGSSLRTALSSTQTRTT